MERTDRTIKIFYTSRIFRILSEIIFHVVFFVQTLIYHTLYGLSVSGREHLGEVDQAVFISNHIHYLDPGFIAQAVWPKRIYFSGLEQTFSSNRLFGLFIRSLGGFPIPESAPGRIIRPLAERLGETHRSLHLFPEGSMVLGHQRIRTFEQGAFSLARFFDLPIVPVTEKIIPRRFFPFPKVVLVIGEPLYPKHYQCSGRSRGQQISDMSEAARALMQEEASLC